MNYDLQVKYGARLFATRTQKAKPDFSGRKLSLTAYEKPKKNANTPLENLNRLDLLKQVQCCTQVELDSNSCFEVDGVLAGIVAVTLDLGNSEFQPLQTQLESLDEGDEIDLEIEVAKAVLVEGRLLTADNNEPVDSVQISIRSAAKPLGSRLVVKSDRRGSFRAYLHMGEYTVQPFDFSEWDRKKDYSYAPSVLIKVTSQVDSFKVPDLLFPPLQRETGKLIDSNGKALANRQVAWLPNGARHPVKHGVSDVRGNLGHTLRRASNWYSTTK